MPRLRLLMLLSACGASVAMETDVRASAARLHALHRLPPPVRHVYVHRANVGGGRRDTAKRLGRQDSAYVSGGLTFARDL